MKLIGEPNPIKHLDFVPNSLVICEIILFLTAISCAIAVLGVAPVGATLVKLSIVEHLLSHVSIAELR